MKHTKTNRYRQGDILIEEINTIPTGLKPIKRDKGRVILAYGETSGHCHAISDQKVKHLASPDADVTYLEIQTAMALLQHDEHAPIPLPAGRYRVRRQRQYVRKQIVRVQD